jgi:mono/diheme cytochrome c family protein
VYTYGVANELRIFGGQVVRVYLNQSKGLLFFSAFSLLILLACTHFTNFTAAAAAAQPQAELAAKGKQRFAAYKCGDCHGDNGEGTPDGPDLTHSKKTADEVSRFLQKPSADAINKGMPDIPKDDPDHAPLVAYVMSIRAK